MIQVPLPEPRGSSHVLLTRERGLSVLPQGTLRTGHLHVQCLLAFAPLAGPHSVSRPPIQAPKTWRGKNMVVRIYSFGRSFETVVACANHRPVEMRGPTVGGITIALG